MRARWFGFRVSVLAMLSCASLACSDDGGGDDPGGCLQNLSVDCGSIVWTDYQAIWDNRLSGCGSADTQGNCHSAQGRMGGLLLSDADTAYDALLGGQDGKARVIPTDPACSELVKRITSTDRAYQMPPNSPMTAVEQCSIIQWIAKGAER